MRIISGVFRGRAIVAPKGPSTRPTTDRVREALFSSLVSASGPDLGGGAVLDAFAGSGALGLEALSRGCTSCTFAERDRHALEALRTNIASLGVPAAAARVVPTDAFALAARPVGGPFSLILLDPPYTLDPGRITEMLDALVAAGAVRNDALVSFEHSTAREFSWPAGFFSVKSKNYGTTAIDIARYEREAGEK